jgi:hypothetical protein
VAQLVEHDLAKVGVAGSSPVFRSESIRGFSSVALKFGRQRRELGDSLTIDDDLLEGRPEYSLALIGVHLVPVVDEGS